MATVTLSQKYQIVIPKEVRLSLDLHPGQKIQVLVYEGRAEFVPVRDAKRMQGFLRGMDTSVLREPDRT